MYESLVKKGNPNVESGTNRDSYENYQNGESSLPGNIKVGAEKLGGYAMDDVNVHYNSSKPAEMNAYAYTQGNNIHIAPKQEKYLAHEAWHVVQQKQGRVSPTIMMKGIGINDNSQLEKEADVMGAKIESQSASLESNTVLKQGNNISLHSNMPVQRAVRHNGMTYNNINITNPIRNQLIQKLRMGLEHYETSGATEYVVGKVVDLALEANTGLNPFDWGSLGDTSQGDAGAYRLYLDIIRNRVRTIGANPTNNVNTTNTNFPGLKSTSENQDTAYELYNCNLYACRFLTSIKSSDSSVGYSPFEVVPVLKPSILKQRLLERGFSANHPVETHIHSRMADSEFGAVIGSGNHVAVEVTLNNERYIFDNLSSQGISHDDWANDVYVKVYPIVKNNSDSSQNNPINDNLLDRRGTSRLYTALPDDVAELHVKYIAGMDKFGDGNRSWEMSASNWQTGQFPSGWQGLGHGSAKRKPVSKKKAKGKNRRRLMTLAELRKIEEQESDMAPINFSSNLQADDEQKQDTSSDEILAQALAESEKQNDSVDRELAIALQVELNKSNYWEGNESLNDRLKADGYWSDQDQKSNSISNLYKKKYKNNIGMISFDENDTKNSISSLYHKKYKKHQNLISPNDAWSDSPHNPYDDMFWDDDMESIRKRLNLKLGGNHYNANDLFSSSKSDFDISLIVDRCRRTIQSDYSSENDKEVASDILVFKLNLFDNFQDCVNWAKQKKHKGNEQMKKKLESLKNNK